MFKPIIFNEKVNNCTLNMLLKMYIFLYTLKHRRTVHRGLGGGARAPSVFFENLQTGPPSFFEK